MDAAALLPPILPDLNRYARRLTRNGQDREDLVQETCVKALANFNQFYEERGRFRKWCLSIMHGIFIDGRRRAYTQRRYAPALAARALHISEAQQEHALLLREVLGAVDEDTTYNSTLVMQAAFGWDSGELAERHTDTIPAVKSRLHLARKRLRTRLHWANETPACHVCEAA